MKTTKFAFRLKNNEILIITKSGECQAFQQQLSAQLRMMILKEDDSITTVIRNHPGGIWTIIPEDQPLTFVNVWLICEANSKRVKVLQDQKAEEDRKIENEKRQKATAREAELITELRQQPKGWYVVTFSAMVSKIKGNDGWQTFTWKVLADNGYDAFEKAIEGFNSKMPRNVSFVYNFDSISNALIEYVGVWTDESELEYGTC